ncbi:hypothetical protein bpr_III108 [Butyrivibrio proteoclasticus B316]|uniref:Uncharacterized protein n=1 Tax=Butyrivibrio proteoclasticus (strain ATCC 51982 / DSM 14932 / B316) TaxID=515622 RepID=E0S314_BUTPB|nr:hypothetical protein [Butyrivibrio proteoclasticus]ADL35796.1 hypothetical protein bpr_III108 [Butyrivibrio proteoclasticus B316]
MRENEIRDPNRIRPFLEKIAQHWEKCPDLRFGQLVLNTVNDNNLLYNIEEDDFLKKLDSIFVITEDEADYRGAHDYFSMTIECSRSSIYPSIVRDFYELLTSQGFRFVSGFWDYTDVSYENIIKTNQKKLEESYVRPYGTDDLKDDYIQLLFDYDGNQETRSYICNSPEEDVFTFEIIIPEEDLLSYENGKIHYVESKINTLIELAKKIWELPFVDVVQTFLEYSDIPKTFDELKGGIEALAVEPFAIIPNKFDKGFLKTRFDVSDISKDGLLVRTKE